MPITTPDGETLLYEAYFRYDGVVEAGRRAWLRFAPVTLGSLLFLELLQVPLVLVARVAGCGARRSSASTCSSRRSRPPTPSADGSPATSTTASCRTSRASRSRSRPPPDASTARPRCRSARPATRCATRFVRCARCWSRSTRRTSTRRASKPRSPTSWPSSNRAASAARCRSQAPDDMTLDATQLVYRTAQEGLRNVVAHADATPCRSHGLDRTRYGRAARDRRRLWSRSCAHPPEAGPSRSQGARRFGGVERFRHHHRVGTRQRDRTAPGGAPPMISRHARRRSCDRPARSRASLRDGRRHRGRGDRRRTAVRPSRWWPSTSPTSC